MNYETEFGQRWQAWQSSGNALRVPARKLVEAVSELVDDARNPSAVARYVTMRFGQC